MGFTDNIFVALCALGCEKIACNEIKKLGFTPLNRKIGRIFFSSKEELFLSVFKANYFLRSVDRIFLLLARQKIRDFDSFFSLIYSIEWESFFTKDSHIIIDKVSTFNSKLASEHTLQTMAQKAICNRLCDKWHCKKLDIGKNQYTIRIYLDCDELFLCLDTSGEPLYKRGYRLKGGLAPIRESLATATLHIMQWKRKYPLHDAFAGSGTIPIEALYYALNVPAGINRSFAFETFNSFPRKSIENKIDKIKENAIKNIRIDCEIRISASDIDNSSIRIAKFNIQKACNLIETLLLKYEIKNHITPPMIFQNSFEHLNLPHKETMLLSNLPYGIRLSDEEKVISLYKAIAKKIKDLKAFKLGFITNRKEIEKIFKKENKKLKIKEHPIRVGKLQTYLYILEQ